MRLSTKNFSHSTAIHLLLESIHILTVSLVVTLDELSILPGKTSKMVISTHLISPKDTAQEIPAFSCVINSSLSTEYDPFNKHAITSPICTKTKMKLTSRLRL